jgi:NitT/TauT family transport system substrate-binding protein
MGTAKKWVTILSAVVFLAGSAARDAVAQDKVVLRMGLPAIGLHHLPVLIADARGYFAEQGLQFTMNFMRGGSEAAAALTAGNIDVMNGAFAHAVNLRAKGIPVKFLVANAGVRDFALVVDAKRHAKVASVAQLKGMRIATSRRGSDGDQLTRFLLEQAGLDPDRDATLIQIGGYQNHLTAIEKGDVDASMILEPFLTLGVRKGTIKTLVDFLKGEGPDVVHKRIWTGLMVTDGFYRDRRDVCVRIVRAIVRAVRSISDDPEGTLAATQKHFPTIEADTLREILKRHVEVPRGRAFLASVGAEALNAENQFLVKFGVIKTAQTYEDVVGTAMSPYWQ